MDREKFVEAMERLVFWEVSLQKSPVQDTEQRSYCARKLRESANQAFDALQSEEAPTLTDAEKIKNTQALNQRLREKGIWGETHKPDTETTRFNPNEGIMSDLPAILILSGQRDKDRGELIDWLETMGEFCACPYDFEMQGKILDILREESDE